MKNDFPSHALGDRQAENGLVREWSEAQPRLPRPPVQASSAPEAGYLDQDLSRFFYKWCGLLSQTLIRARSQFDGDLHQYLLYLIFLLAELSQIVGRADAEARDVLLCPRADRGMNALSLAEITHIPRETARRKLQLLVSRGYLSRSDDSLYHLGDRYDRYGLDAFFRHLSPLSWDGVATDRRRAGSFDQRLNEPHAMGEDPSAFTAREP